MFVPWALSGVVGEWNFYHTGGDPADIIDEHWYMTDYHVSRETYHERPMYPLKGRQCQRAGLCCRTAGRLDSGRA